ncbi:MAG: low-specificity L-threonine aldolase [Trueperaceae bacterium]|nr:low-specificity L-threonine aldolase [Trueperaceae bacterium]
MPMIDLRSDTVTKPTAVMRKAMAEAEVGDDVYGEDPTVNRLQALTAEMTGFEAALFMPTGSQSNQVALATHAARGYEVIAPEGAHIYEYEIGALCVLSGLIPRLVKAPYGIPEVKDVHDAIKRSIHQAPTGMIVLENTHNKAGGTIVPMARSQQIADLAKNEGLPFHLDGARGFNAAVALGLSLEAFCKPYDSVSLCLSKGLGAPVGTMLVGSKDFIGRAHRYRKMFGGGMRQAGILAAAGIVALETMIDRLAEDHARAKALATGLSKLEGISLDLNSVQTNMVYFSIADAPALAGRMKEAGVLCNALGPTSIRLVTHHHIRDEDIETALKVIEEALEPSLSA